MENNEKKLAENPVEEENISNGEELISVRQLENARNKIYNWAVGNQHSITAHVYLILMSAYNRVDDVINAILEQQENARTENS